MIGAVVQARTGSSRLPNKVMRAILGKPLLQYLIERLRASTRVERIVVATTRAPEDDSLAALAQALGVACTRGSASDVLDRYYQAAREHGLDHVVRVGGDSPLIDPTVVDRVVDRYLELLPNVDYVSNTLRATYPDGLDLEVFSLEFLATLHRLADKPYQREHVCTYMLENRHLFRCENVEHNVNLAHHRWTVDNAEDFELIRRIIEALYPTKPLFLMEDVLGLLAARPELVEMNRHIQRNEGFIRSLENQGLSRDEKEKIVQTVLGRPL
jgi:spore coat polysaccharide biosynthesis protein SpsF